MVAKSPPYSLDDLRYLMQRLRDPADGCPWDLKQDYRSIAVSTLEEAFEVVDAIEREDYPDLREELGDLLFQVIYHSQLAEEEQRFDVGDVISDLVTKLVRRHPHVFPDGTLQSRAAMAASPEGEANIKQRWEALKQQEREGKGKAGVLDDVPVNFPALTRAAKLQKRAAGVGFDWPGEEGVLEKIAEELEEVRDALDAAETDAVEEELGDLLFAVVNLCRHRKVDPEKALRRTNRKFEQRFRFIEQQLAAQGISPAEATLDEMDNLWNQAKAESRGETIAEVRNPLLRSE
ncbi:nucleoside triphosphate pyrophosphohydrolase [Pseudomaricurvus sp. HS19]|uniref:nucleoside triphosphate pyrophosphohydrolase n=1 Tax=Pseudomaricurvus sp. HS19 TaxID=2692626 RepID=UPI00136BB470|nr:nucleoside triphosphate pyrophosphohydrolase [Pseudomaricurvus sp. HS19]MYM62566.1 nucleoside triphosphate pyrophosphohydrolase [Pseudomaricurvus sp. HS19]